MGYLSLYLSVAAVSASLVTSAFATSNPDKEEIPDDQCLVPVSLELKSAEETAEMTRDLDPSNVTRPLITPLGGMEASIDEKVPAWTQLGELNRAIALKPKNINDLPNEMLAEILGKLPLKFLRKAAQVCKNWHDLSERAIVQAIQEPHKVIDLAQFAPYSKLASLQTLLRDSTPKDLQAMMKEALYSYLMDMGQEDFNKTCQKPGHIILDAPLAQNQATSVGSYMWFLEMLRLEDAIEGGTSDARAEIIAASVARHHLWALDNRALNIMTSRVKYAFLEKLFKTGATNKPWVNQWLANYLFKQLPDPVVLSTAQVCKRLMAVASNGWLASSKPFAGVLAADTALSQLSESDFLKWAIEYGNSFKAFDLLRSCDVTGWQWKSFLQKLVREKGHVFAAECLLLDALSAGQPTTWLDWTFNGFKSEVQELDMIDQLIEFDVMVKDCASNQDMARKIFGAAAKTEAGWSKLCHTLANVRVKNMLEVLKAQPSVSAPLMNYDFLVDQVKGANLFAVWELAKLIVKECFVVSSQQPNKNFDWYFKILRAKKD